MLVFLNTLYLHYKNLIFTLCPARGRPEFWAALRLAGRLQFDNQAVLTISGLFFGFIPCFKHKIITVTVGYDDGVFCSTVR